MPPGPAYGTGRRSARRMPIFSCSVPTRNSARGFSPARAKATRSATERTATGSVLGCPLKGGSGRRGNLMSLPRVARGRRGSSGSRCLREEALQEVAERLLELGFRGEREGLAGPFGLAGVERPHQRHLAARLHGDDRAMASPAEVELDRPHVLVV